MGCGATVYDTDDLRSAGNPTSLTVPAGVSKVRLKGNIDWTFDGTGGRDIAADELTWFAIEVVE